MPILPSTDKQQARLFDATVNNNGVLFARARKDGSHFPVFADATPMMWEPETFRIANELLAKRIKELKPDIVAGGLTGGAAIAAAVAMHADTSYALVRKEPKGYSQARTVDGKIKKGDKVVLIDDFFSSGGTAELFIDFIERAGGEVIQILTYGMLSEKITNTWTEKSGVSVESIYLYADLVKHAHKRGVIDDEALDLTLATVNDLYGWHKDPQYVERAEVFYKKHGSKISS